MKACGEAITDQQIVEKIMRTSRFDFIVVATQESKDMKTLKIEELQSSLEAHELMVSERSSERSIQQALQVQIIEKDGYDRKTFKKGKNNNKGGNWSKGKNKGSDKSESSKEGNSHQNKKKGFDKKKIQCFKCEKFGHFAYKCWSGKGKQAKNDEEQAKIVQDNSDSLLFMVTTTSIESCNSESWFLDTGCSNHMTGNKVWLREVDLGKNTKVKLVDHRTLTAERMVKIAIEGKNGKITIIEDVFYVSGMQCNLLSVDLIQKGYSVTMKDNSLKLFDKNQSLVLKTPLAKNRTFQTNMKAVELNCLFVIVKDEDSWLWHYRFGYLYFRGLNQLVDK